MCGLLRFSLLQCRVRGIRYMILLLALVKLWMERHVASKVLTVLSVVVYIYVIRSTSFSLKKKLLAVIADMFA